MNTLLLRSGPSVPKKNVEIGTCVPELFYRKNDVCCAIARMQNNDDSGLYNTFIKFRLYT